MENNNPNINAEFQFAELTAKCSNCRMESNDILGISEICICCANPLKYCSSGQKCLEESNIIEDCEPEMLNRCVFCSNNLHRSCSKYLGNSGKAVCFICESKLYTEEDFNSLVSHFLKRDTVFDKVY